MGSSLHARVLYTLGTMLSQRKLILGVTGSIAAYKSVYLLRRFQEARARVRVVLTRGATRFVGAMTFSAITGERAVTDLLAGEAGTIPHVELAHDADAVVIAPTTADTLARLASGRADDPVCALALATTKPLVIAPAMETGMWQNPATQANVRVLVQRGAHLVMPAEGKLASGHLGQGRMAEPDTILERVIWALTPNDLDGHRIVVTAGPTREHIDPVRFLSNRSSGKMGYAIAKVAARRGAKVHLISGPTALRVPEGVRFTPIERTQDLLAACADAMADHTCLIMAAAPADFAPAQFSPSKIKKNGLQNDDHSRPALALTRTPDILTTLQPLLKDKLVVGFAAESHDVETRARAKCQAKNLAFIIANDITQTDGGFTTDTNTAIIIGRDGSCWRLPKLHKEALASEILDLVASASPHAATSR